MTVYSLAGSAAVVLFAQAVFTRPVCLADKPKAVLQTKSHGVNCVSFSPDGRTIAAACATGEIELWETVTGKRRAILRRGGVCVAFRGDGRLLASGGWDGKIRLWDMATGKGKAVLCGHTARILSIAFSGDGAMLVSCALKDRTVKVWDVKARTLKGTFEGHSSPVWCVALSGDGKLLASGAEDGWVKIWDIEKRNLKATLLAYSPDDPAAVHSVAFRSDSKLLAAGGDDRIVRVWEVATGKLQAALKGQQWTVSSVAFSPDGKLVASVSGDGLAHEEWEEPPGPAWEIKLWDVATGRPRAALSDETGGQLFSVAFSPDGKRLATGGWHDDAFPKDGPGTVRLWKVNALLNGKR